MGALTRLRLRASLAAALAVGAPASALAVAKHEVPVPAATLALMAQKGMAPDAPILLRAFKKEAEIEVWKRDRTGRFALLKTFPVCRWSGALGPKERQGDRQVPEGFYTVAPRQMNPNSAYYLSFDVGFPNAYDRQHGATGSAIMVHGTCSSAGCFAMTDRQVGEIYALAREAFRGGQGAFQFQSYPFRMSALAMTRHRADRHIAFWRDLKEGYDRFEATGEEPSVRIEAGRYRFAPSRDAAREALAQARRADEEARIAALVSEGQGAIRTTYADGGQNAVFAALARRGVPLGDVSRPEALPAAGREIVVIPSRVRRPATVQVAAATPTAGLMPAGLMAEAARPPRPSAGPDPSPFWPAALAWRAAAAAGPQVPLEGAARILPGSLAPPPVRLAEGR